MSGADDDVLVKIVKSARKHRIIAVNGVDIAVAVSCRSNLPTNSLSEDPDVIRNKVKYGRSKR